MDALSAIAVALLSVLSCSADEEALPRDDHEPLAPGGLTIPALAPPGTNPIREHSASRPAAAAINRTPQDSWMLVRASARQAGSRWTALPPFSRQSAADASSD